MNALARSGAIVVASVLTAVAIGTSAFADSSVPNLVGTWSGSGNEGAVQGTLGHQASRQEPVFADRSILWTLKIDRHDGRGLIGFWSSPTHVETLVGVIRSDNESLLFSDEDSLFQAKLLSPTSMEVCAQESGSALIATCRVLEKQ
ncbi:MAG: hypothetical protein GY791_08535 [Alphaproteobacteria bacterium]|nr:hypothetical protein [Alphaproteobacteria bacterium]